MARYNLLVGPNISDHRLKNVTRVFAGVNFKVLPFEERFSLLEYVWEQESKGVEYGYEFVWREFTEHDFTDLQTKRVGYLKIAIQLLEDRARMYLVHLGED